MKRKILFLASFLFISWAVTSCTALSDCQFCKIVTRTSTGSDVSVGSPTEYCGADLITFKASNPTITNPVTGNITKVECSN